MDKQPNTPRKLIEWGARAFQQAGLEYRHGTDNAADEAAWIVMHLLDIGYDQPDPVLDRELDEADRKRVLAMLQERVATRKPAAYLLQRAWFCGLPFVVDERVLVPRSPIAELIEAGFAPWVSPEKPGAILDLCTGSGCIGIACAFSFPDATVDLADLSDDALDIAQANIDLHRLGKRVKTVRSDVFSALSGRRYDIIVSNPPYVPREEYRQLAAEFMHEPGMGLEAGEDGLDIVVRILADAGDYLAADGMLVVEVGNSEENLVTRFPDVPFTWLEFEHGGSGVFLLEADQLSRHRYIFERTAAEYAGRRE